MTHYEVLGVEPEASAAEIRRAYLALARRHHPDQHATAGPAERRAAERAMRELNAAWQVLADPGERAAYDAALRRREAPGGTTEPPAAGFTPGRAHPDFVPIDPDDDPVDPRLVSDGPIEGAVAVARWQQIAPPGLVALGILGAVVGFVLGSRAVLGAAAVVFVLGVVAFALVPMLTVLRTSR